MPLLLKKLVLGVNIFILGVTALAAITSFGFEAYYQGKIYPGVKIDNLNFGGQTESEVARYFTAKLSLPGKIVFKSPTATAEYALDPKKISLRYDVRLMSSRAFSVGRQTNNFYDDFLQKITALGGTINLPLEATFDLARVTDFEDMVDQEVAVSPTEAQFKFESNSGPDQKGRVVAFKQSKNGRQLDREKLETQLKSVVLNQACLRGNCNFTLPITILPPKITKSRADQLGITSLLGSGVSYFYDSIPSRVENIRVGTEKINGSLIAPGETFSFDTAIGTVSAIFGFQKAYVIRENKTVLEDGGGVCQVSTTLYRAVLNSGLPVIERVAHAYRVPYYEEGGFQPGLDATVYPPSPDFRFKNDTPGWILIQATFDEANSKLTFDLFGTDDGRQTVVSTPVILSTTPPPPPVYEDRPDLPAGTLQQIDTAHWGAKTVFTRKVTRNGTVLIDESVSSDFIPWPARYLRGTKP